MKTSFEELNKAVAEAFYREPKISALEYYEMKNQTMVRYITETIIKNEQSSAFYRHVGIAPKEDFALNIAIKSTLKKFRDLKGYIYDVIYELGNGLATDMSNAYESFNILFPVISANRENLDTQKHLTAFLEDIVATEFLLKAMSNNISTRGTMQEKLIESNKILKAVLEADFPFKPLIHELEVNPNLEDGIVNTRKSYVLLFMIIYLYEYGKKIKDNSYEPICFKELSVNEFSRQVDSYLEINQMRKLGVQRFDTRVCGVIRTLS